MVNIINMDKLKTLKELYDDHGINIPLKDVKTSELKVSNLIPILAAFRLRRMTSEDLLRFSVLLNQDQGFYEDIIKRIGEI